MKKIKRILTAFLVVAVLLCTAPMTAFAATDYKLNYVVVELTDENDVVWITDYEGKLPSKLKIPKKIKGMLVQSIEPNAFYGSSIKEQVLPEGLVWIESSAFANCKKLEKITIPSTLQRVSNAAFYGCNKIKKVIYNGYYFDFHDLYIDLYNDDLFTCEWIWSHYRDEDIPHYESEGTFYYNYPDYLTINSELLNDGETVAFENRDYADIFSVSSDGEIEIYGNPGTKTTEYVCFEIRDADGYVVADGLYTVNVKLTPLQWIVNYLCFGWLWGYLPF